jgi:hypothetical protein
MGLIPGHLLAAKGSLRGLKVKKGDSPNLDFTAIKDRCSTARALSVVDESKKGIRRKEEKRSQETGC